MPTTTNSTRRNKHLILDQSKLTRARRVLGAKTDTETIERALTQVISEDESNRRAWAAQERFLKTAVQEGWEINDVFGRLEG